MEFRFCSNKLKGDRHRHRRRHVKHVFVIEKGNGNSDFGILFVHLSVLITSVAALCGSLTKVAGNKNEQPKFDHLINWIQFDILIMPEFVLLSFS